MLLKEKFPISYRFVGLSAGFGLKLPKVIKSSLRKNLHRFADYHRIVFESYAVWEYQSAITQSNQEFLKSAYNYYDKGNKKRE